MTKYRMDDGTLVDTDRANASWKEARDFDGHNRIGRSSGSQWSWQALYKSRKGRYYIEHTANIDGHRPHVEWVSREEAARFLLLNDYELPEDLAGLDGEIVE